MISNAFRIACITLFSAFGCGKDSTSERFPPENIERLQKATEVIKLRDKIKGEIKACYQQWRDSVSARHPNWDAAFRDAQLDILEEKWEAGHPNDEELAILAMSVYAPKKVANSIQSDLVKSDYQDIFHAMKNVHILQKQAQDLQEEFHKYN